MKNTRILLFSIFAVMITSTVIGCFITYGLAPTAALARIFIDIGATIALAWIAYSLPKPEIVNADDIVDGLRDLAKNRFDRRLVIRENDELFQVRQAFNELAGTLSDSRDPSLTHIRYNPMHRVELKVTPLPVANHSLHPELGQVRSAPEMTPLPMPVQPAVITYPDPTPNLSFLTENVSDHALEQAPATVPELEMHAELLEEEPREEAPQVYAEELLPVELRSEETMMPEAYFEALAEAIPEPMAAEPIAEAPQPEPMAAMPTPAPARPESYASDIGAADLFFLFERFKAAHDDAEQNNIDFDTFLMSVQQAREDLIRTHKCRDVKFEVVSQGGAVALRPRLIR